MAEMTMPGAERSHPPREVGVIEVEYRRSTRWALVRLLWYAFWDGCLHLTWGWRKR